ncbi:MAG TPA: hypothetical protein VG602_06190 [Actinomycetota bacterium]|nr:hypothetical protein [Actinomycetota bacterium]
MRVAVVALGSVAILFAPAGGEDPGGTAASETIGARILAPTVTEALVVDAPRFPRSPVEQSDGALVLAGLVAAGVAVSMFATLRDPGSGRVPTVLAVRTWVPRGPPTQSA